MCLRRIKIEENGTARQPDDEHQGDERCLPDKEPDGSLLAVVVVLEGHHPRHDLRLPRHAQTAEEERTDPQRDPERQVSRKQVHHARVDVLQGPVEAGQATHLCNGHVAQNRGAHNHHTGLGCVGPNRRPNATGVAVCDNEHESDEDAQHFRPAQHGAQRHATSHELSGGVNREEEDGEHAGKFGFGCTGRF